MQIIENSKVKEKVLIEKLSNGLTVMIIPKKNTNKKSAIYGTKFGSIDNHFIHAIENKEVQIPDGVAHFLEHKMFEQEDGTNSLDTLSALGVEANAYTTNDHTAYLFNGTENFEDALQELMNYVQNPYFTDENVEKEKGIIGQEIRMYDDDPVSKIYLNLLNCLYQENPVKLDIAGTVESIEKINKGILYDSYNTFYSPSNMVLVICGDFDEQEILNKIKRAQKDNQNNEKIKRIYPTEKNKINQSRLEEKMNVSNPIFAIGIKDTPVSSTERIKRNLIIEILSILLLGNSSPLYQELYKQGNLAGEVNLEYDFSDEYAYITISGQAKDPDNIFDRLKKEISKMKQNGISQEDYERIKKKVYGSYIIEYNDPAEIVKTFLVDYLHGIHTFDFLEEFSTISKEDVENGLKEVFIEENMAISIIKPKD